MITRECALRLRCNGQGVPAREDILRRYCSTISAAQRVKLIIRLRVEGANQTDANTLAATRGGSMVDDLQTAQGSGLPVASPTNSGPSVRRPAKFRNTANPTETWSGRGKRPNWLKAQLAAGRTLEEFRICD